MNQIADAIRKTHGPEAAAEFEQRLRTLNAKVQAAYPGKPLPHAMVVGSNYPFLRDTAALVQFQGGQIAVVIGDRALAKLTPAQAVALIAHEYGHHHLTPTPNNYWSYWYYANLRIDECRTDHFASRFLDRPEDLADGLRAIRAGDTDSSPAYLVRALAETFYLGGNSHPHDTFREIAMAEPSRRAFPTESIRFHSDCSIRDITSPLATLPRLPELPAPYRD